MAMIISRLNAPADGPYQFAEDLKCCHVRLTFDAVAYAAGGYSLNEIAKMYGINRVQYGICHTISWINTLTASAGDVMKLAYAEVVESTNRIIVRQIKENAAAGDPEVGALNISDAVFDMTLFGI